MFHPKMTLIKLNYVNHLVIILQFKCKYEDTPLHLFSYYLD